MRVVLWLIIFLQVPPVFADVFDLTRNEDQVCKTVPGRDDKTCYTSLAQESPEVPQFHGTVEVVEQVQALNALIANGGLATIKPEDFERIGGALMLSQVNRELIIKNFKRISVRDIAIDKGGLQQLDDGTISVPFFANIYWIGADEPSQQDMIGVDGVFTIKEAMPQAFQKATTVTLGDSMNAFLSQMLQIRGVSDTTTEARQESLRNLEYVARTELIRQLYGGAQNTEDGTKQLIVDVVGPAVIGDLVYVPLLKGLIQAFVDMIPNP